MKRALLVVLGLARVAGADVDPCADPIRDPVVTPLRDAAIDAQRSACLRNELAAHALASALIDTPGFHGVLGGELRIHTRLRVGADLELDAGIRAIRYVFVQNAVNKVTDVGFGPLTVGGMWSGRFGDGARIGLTGLFEIPATRSMRDTTHVGGELGAVVTAALTSRTSLHTRLDALAAHARSAGGTTSRLALRAGTDLARKLGTRFALSAGVELQAGWVAGLDHVGFRGGLHARFGDRWRGQVGIGIPIGGEERTTAVVDLGLVRDLW